MENDVIKIISKLLDNSNDRIVEIRNDVFNSLGVNMQSEKIVDFVKECLEKFDFNIVEQNFFNQVKDIVLEEINDKNIKNDKTSFINNLVERLRQIKVPNISINDNLLQLANQITSRFPEINISRDQFYSHFISKKEQIIGIINQHNQNVIDTIIKLTPQLANELENQLINNSINLNEPINAQTSHQTISNPKPTNNNSDFTIEKFLSRCTEKVNEMNLMFQNTLDGKSEIAKGLRELKKFTSSLNDKSLVQEILDRCVKLNEITPGVVYDNVIFENVPMLKDIYNKYQETLTVKNVKKAATPNNPDTPNTNAYVGMSENEIRELINQKKYYSILQGISKEEMSKYDSFINTGYRIIINNFLTSANECKTYEEKHNAYFELYEIYQNFRDYISLEASNQLKEQLDSMYNYLQQHAQINEDVGIRYNSSKVESSNSSMRR